MNPTQTRPPTPPRRIAWFVWLGVALLGVTVLGASKSLQSSSETPVNSSSKTSDLLVGGFGHVDVEGGVTNMFALQPGQVVEVLAHDGDEVEKGAPLFRMDDELAQIEVERRHNAVVEAELQLSRAKTGIDQHQAALNARRKIIEAKKSRVKIAESKVEESERLFKAGHIGSELVDQAKEAVKGLQADVEAEQEQERGILAEKPMIAVSQAENNLEEKQQLVHKAQFGLDKCTMKAPARGKVLRMFVAVGDTLGPMPRQPAVQFATAGPLIIRAEIDQEFAARIDRGQTAEVQDDVRTSQPWSGKVQRISDWYTHRRSILLEPLQFNDVRTLEVIISLENPPPGLKIGQRVRVTLK